MNWFLTANLKFVYKLKTSFWTYIVTMLNGQTLLNRVYKKIEQLKTKSATEAVTKVGF